MVSPQRGGVDSGDVRFYCRVCRYIGNDFGSGDRTLSFANAAGPRRCPEGQTSPRAGLMSHINQKSARGIGVSTPCGAASTWGMSVFAPGYLKLFTYGNNFSSGNVGHYHPRVRRTSALSRGATLAGTGSIRPSQSQNIQGPGGSPSLSPAC